MTLYPQSILDEIRDRISIVSYISEHVPLKKLGRNHKGLCPFHSEKTPSFMVSEEKEIFHCFGCGEGGNIFNFVMKYEGLSFVEAVEHLAARAGITLPKKDQSPKDLSQAEEALKKKKLLFQINRFVAQFFRRTLQNETLGARARNYLKTRGISDDISTQHFLGYAEDSWDALYRHLKSKNAPLQLVHELGLMKRRSADGDYYDFFRARLIFPIISPRLEVLGFGGRIFADSEDKETAKYLNSPDSMIYHKSHSVYGLNVAQKEIRQADQAIIVEGYMDVLALNQAAISNVVAPLGTALTASHIRLLSRYTKNMVLIFDGDEAGLKAAERSLSGFMEVGIMPKVVVLPNGNDPDDYVRSNGGSDLKRMINESESLFAWYIKRKVRDCATDVSKKFVVISELKPLFKNIESSLEFSHYRKLLSDELKMDENDLLKQMEYKGSKGGLKTDKGGVAGKLLTEKLLLSLMFEYPDYISRVKENIDLSYFSDESFRTIFQLLMEESDKGKFSVGRLLDRVCDDELMDSIHSIAAGGDVDSDSASKVLEDCIKYLVKCRFSEQLKVITEGIKTAEKSGDEEKVLALVSEKNRLLSAGLL